MRRAMGNIGFLRCKVERLMNDETPIVRKAGANSGENQMELAALCFTRVRTVSSERSTSIHMGMTIQSGWRGAAVRWNGWCAFPEARVNRAGNEACNV